MPTERKDRGGPKMPTKPKITRIREWPETEVESTMAAADTRVALESKDRSGTGMSTKPKISRDREWPKVVARIKKKVSAVKKKAAGKKAVKKISKRN